MEWYRSGHNENDSKSCYPCIETEYFSFGDVPKRLKGLHSKCSRGVKARESSNLSISANPLKSGVSAGFFFASCDCCPSLDQDTGILPLPAPACTGAMIYALPAGSANGNRSTAPIVRCSGLTSPQSGHGCNPLSAASCPMRPQYRRDEAYFRPVSDNFRP